MLGPGLQRVITIKGQVRSQQSEMSFQDQATRILSEANWHQNISRLKSSITTHLLQRISQRLHKITSLIPTKNKKSHRTPPLLSTSLALPRSPYHRELLIGQTSHVFGHALQHNAVLHDIGQRGTQTARIVCSMVIPMSTIHNSLQQLPATLIAWSMCIVYVT